MNININGLNIGQNTKYNIEPGVSGLDRATLRTSEGEYAGRDGGYVSGRLFGKRLITFTGFMKGVSCEEHEELRKDLNDSMPIRQLLPVFITSFNGQVFYTEAYGDVRMDIQHAKFSKFKVDLICPDAYLYDGGDGVDPESGWLEQTINKVIGGGYVTPYDMPVQWTPGTTPSVIENTGDVYIYPQIKLQGQFTNPRITNQTEDKFIELDVTTTTGDEIIIDMRPTVRTITLNGGSIISQRTVDSSWWGLRPGDNTLLLESDNPLDEDSAIVRWRAQFVGM